MIYSLSPFTIQNIVLPLLFMHWVCCNLVYVASLFISGDNIWCLDISPLISFTPHFFIFAHSSQHFILTFHFFLHCSWPRIYLSSLCYISHLLLSLCSLKPFLLLTFPHKMSWISIVVKPSLLNLFSRLDLSLFLDPLFALFLNFPLSFLSLFLPLSCDLSLSLKHPPVKSTIFSLVLSFKVVPISEAQKAPIVTSTFIIWPAFIIECFCGHYSIVTSFWVYQILSFTCYTLHLIMDFCTE